MAATIRAAMSGRYLIERELGHGGFATVYLARDLKHGRRVALKVLKAEVASTIAADRFLQEIRTTASLNHPHILPLFDSGTEDGLVYFTMPYVPGKSLRDRLNQQSTLEPDSAIRLAQQMADALVHAHAAGIVHRDLKPDNVLLGPDDHVWISDFGLCRALSSATDHRLSGTGLAVGSPRYISPEQAAGEVDVDARSDIYSFGCLVFEMLTGEPPFRERTVASLLAKHLSAPTPSARERNPALSASADAALRRAMSKEPADRFADARAFVRALAGDSPQGIASRPKAASHAGAWRWFRSYWPVPVTAVSVALVLFVLNGLSGASFRSLIRRGPPPDTTRFAVLPFSQHGSGETHYAQQRVHEALAFWEGITMVDQFQVEDAVARHGGTIISLDAARRTARGLGAGRFIRGSVTAESDSLLVYAALYDAVQVGPALAEYSMRMHRLASDIEPYFIQLADALLFRNADVPPRSNATDSRPALDAYLAGQQAVARWDLERADSLFTAATTFDGEYGRGLWWLAHVRLWRALTRAEWSHPAERAAGLRDELPDREQELLAAMLALARDDYAEACAGYAALLEQNARDFAAVFGMAECHRRDGLVMRDASSPTGWSFRSSGHLAVQYYKRAFELVPATHRAFRSGRFERLRNNIFYTAPTVTRVGRNAEGEHFRASPAWLADTLAFHPLSVDEFESGARIAGPSTETAIRMMRRIFFEVTTVWVTAYPRSADALEARATAMELLGDGRALPTLREARSLTDDPEHDLNLVISEFWLRIKRAIPRDRTELQAARLLADSILSRTHEEPHTAGRMAAVAAVTGRVHVAARLSRAAVVSLMPVGISNSGAALLAFAAAGGPADSIAVLERAVESAIVNTIAPADADDARLEHLGRAAPLAFPVYRMRIVGTAAGARDYLVAAHAAFANGDRASTRRTLAAMTSTRASLQPADIQFEALLPEAWLFLQMNDLEAARDRLEPTLNAVRFIEPGGLEGVAAAGAFARALLLRAEIAEAVGDIESAQVWSSAFAELWRRADAEVQPLARQAGRLSALRAH
jgi:hypothetical protein